MQATTTSPDPFLQLIAVTKRYAGHLAVNQVSLEIPRGQIYGLLGPNGAGKTSIIRMITSITAPDEGQIFFDGIPLQQDHVYRMGYMPEERGLYKKMKIGEQIVYLLQLKGLTASQANRKCDEWLEKFDLSSWKNHKTQDLSKGMQQKVQFITTVAHEPALLILDEPFSGLDPVNTQIIEQEILRLKAAGTTIIFSTHRMEQVEELCDYIALINKGQLMVQDELLKVRRRFQQDIYDISFQGDVDFVRNIPHTELLKLDAGTAQLRLLPETDGKTVMRHLAQSPLEVYAFSLHIPRLNDIFIQLVKSAQQEPQPTHI